MEYIGNYTTFTQQSIENEVNRYIAWPGQVSSLITVSSIFITPSNINTLYIVLLDLMNPRHVHTK